MKRPTYQIATLLYLLVATGLFISSSTFAASNNDYKLAKGSKKDKLKLETLKIQANKELPKVLFVVPWQNKKQKKGSKNEQRLVLHSLYGDLFDPINPGSLSNNDK